MDNIIFNSTNFDLDGDSEEDIDIEPVVHLRLQMRTVRKSITIVEGLSFEQATKVLKDIRKLFSTNGAVIGKEGDDDIVFQCQGDNRMKIKKYLIDKEITSKENIKVHGF